MIKEINITWGIIDVQTRAEEFELTITDEEASEILQDIERQHDCSVGVTWNTIDYHIEELERQR